MKKYVQFESVAGTCLFDRLPAHVILFIGVVTTGATAAFALGVRPTVYALFGVAVGLAALRTTA